MANPHITPTPSDEEAAAIAAAITALEAQRAAASAGEEPGHSTSMWVSTSRRAAQRAGLQRGPWRMSGRIGRRSRV
jgi:hypothetical protein